MTLWVFLGLFIMSLSNFHTIIFIVMVLYIWSFFLKRAQVSLFLWVFSQIVGWRIILFDWYFQPKMRMIFTMTSWFYYSLNGPSLLYKAFRGYFRIFFFLFYLPYLCVLLSPTGDDAWFDPSFVKEVASGLVLNYTIPWFFIGTVFYILFCSWYSAHYLSSHLYYHFNRKDVLGWLFARFALVPFICIFSVRRCFYLVLFFTARWKLAYNDTEFIYQFFFFSVHFSRTSALCLLVFFILYTGLTYKLYYLYQPLLKLGYRWVGWCEVERTSSWRVPVLDISLLTLLSPPTFFPRSLLGLAIRVIVVLIRWGLFFS